MDYVPIWLREERELGIKIGEEKGKEEKAKETAKKMLEKGFEIDVILDLTGLKREEVEILVSRAH